MMDAKPAHDWILDVLQDLQSYAMQNGLTGLAERVEALMPIAEAEITARSMGDDTPVH
ncbi:hypothetical protein [Falsirhodobacter algicola]|uniref:Uncharacterized protein n=1 Tax=Falsirhodobacter algicola TaxID=2692330 RepID=A0A8J8MQK5_9RHOB|nr:hypothetical protein [Falsirhodobacter algicola]QUS34865.1 hypothetical protein GR316_00420 [Falsirhodobacter algicola]